MLDFQNLIINHPELLEDSKKLRGYMMDIAPDKSDRPQINLLLLLMNDGILESFRRDDGWPALIDSITADVADRWSLDPIKAKKAVEMWYAAYKAVQGATTKEANKQNAADSGNTYFSKLVGVTFQNANGESRQQIIRSLSKSGLLDAGAILQVVREPNNVYDPNAVAIYTPDGQQLGYLNRKDAAYVTQALDAGDKCQVISNGITGGINGNVYGVNITIKVEESAAIKNSASKEVTRDELKQVEQKQSTTPTNPFTVLDDCGTDGHFTTEAKMSHIELSPLFRYDFPRYEEFVKPIAKQHAVVLLYQDQLYAYYPETKVYELLTEKGKKTLAFDVQENMVYVLSCSEIQSMHCYVQSIKFRDNLPPLKKILATIKVNHDEQAKPHLLCMDKQLFIFIPDGLESTALAALDLTTEDFLHTPSFLNQLQVNDCVADGNYIWMLATRVDNDDSGHDDWYCPEGDALYYFDVTTNRLSKPILLAKALSGLKIEKFGMQEQTTHIGFLMCDKLDYQYRYIDGKDAIKGVISDKGRYDNVYAIEDYLFEFTQEDPTEIESSYVESIDITKRYSNTHCWQKKLDYEVKNFCICEGKLYMYGSFSCCSPNLVCMDLQRDGEDVELFHGEFPTPIAETAMNFEEDSEFEIEAYAINAWKNEKEPDNPEHQRIRDKLSAFSISFGSFGICHIIDCAKRVRPVVQVQFENGEKKTYLADVFKSAIAIIGDDGTQLAQVQTLIDQALNTPEHIAKKPYVSCDLLWGNDFCTLSKIDDGGAAKKKFTNFEEAQKEEDRAVFEYAQKHRNKLSDCANMYVILENECTLGYVERSAHDFYQAYKALFIGYSEVELDNLRNEVRENLLQTQYQEYYKHVFEGKDTEERFEVAYLSLFDQYCIYKSKETRANFAEEHSSKWFDKTEHDAVTSLLERTLAERCHLAKERLKEANPAWEAYHSARPYLIITTTTRYIDTDENSLNNCFSVALSGTTYTVCLKTYGTEPLIMELPNQVLQLWRVETIDIWKDALLNTLLRSDEAFSHYSEYWKTVTKTFLLPFRI